MSDSNELKNEEGRYSSFSGMSRKAMLAGAPLMPSMFVLAGSAIIGLIGAAKFGLGGIALTAIGLPVFLWMRVISENDEQALDIMYLEIKCFFLKSNQHIFGRSIALIPTKIGRSINVYKSHFTNILKH